MSAVATGRVVVIADGPGKWFPVDSTMEGITKQNKSYTEFIILIPAHWFQKRIEQYT